MLESLPSLRDSLLIIAIALGVYLLLVALAQVIRRARGLRFGWTYHGFALLSGLVIGIHLSNWKNDVASIALQQLTALALLLSAFPLAKIVNRIAWMR
ncbi:MAG TPA: hypothetical protein PLN52_17125, partial [Opitutaceae bacterium]|nr:hypothetical protein [Opitutaceae bacterium]